MPICTNCSMEFAKGEQKCPFCGEPVSADAAQRTPMIANLIGHELPGGYVIREKIATGGMAVVYKAEQVALGRSVAVKVMHHHLLYDPTTATRFMNEARAASRLNHPHTLSVIDFGRMTDGRPYMIMEFLRGKNLDELVRNEGMLTFRRIIEIFFQLLDALSEAHELGIIHRDLKPENIIIESLRSGEDFVKVVDFGLAKIITESETTGVTGTGTVCGTPDFMSPEQCQAKSLDGRTDIYSLGVVLFFLLTNRLPFEGKSAMEILIAHVTKAVPDPRHIAPDRQIPDALAEICLRALKKAPEERFQTAEEFSKELEEIRSDLMEGTSRISFSPMQKTRCPNCGGWSLAGSKFCGECGEPLTLGGRGLRTIPPKTSSISPDSSRNLKTATGLPLIGRSEAIVQLLNLLQGSSSDQLLIVGQPGVGKSSLLKAFKELAERRGHFVTWLQPDPWRRFSPLSPIQQMIRQILLPDELNDVLVSRPGIAELLKAKAEEAPGMSDIERMGKTLRWVLEYARTRHPDAFIVIIADDVHHYDTVTQILLGQLAALSATNSLVVLGTASTAESVPWPETVTTVELPELSLEDSKRLMLFAGVPESLIPRFEAPATPLYVEQLASAIIDGQRDFPSSLGDLIASRLARLPLQQRQLMQYMSVLPDGFDAKRLSSALQVSPSMIDGNLTELRKGRFVFPGPLGSSCLHEIVREVVKATTPVEVMRKVYISMDSVLDFSHVPLEPKAYYAMGTEDSFQTLLLLDKAAAYAYKRGDMAGAVRLLSDALSFSRSELSRGVLNDPMQAVVLFARKLGEVLLRIRSLTDAEGVLTEALDFSTEFHPETIKLLLSLGDVWRHRGESNRARKYWEQSWNQLNGVKIEDDEERKRFQEKTRRRLQKRLALVEQE